MKDEYVSKEAVLKYIRKVAETAHGDCKDAIGDAYNYLADDLEMHIIRPSIVKPPEGEYISKKKAVDELCFDYAYAAAEIIKKMPGIDAAPVVHGKDLAQPSLFKCSVCGCEDDDTYTCDVSEYRFCPACGAKIDEKAKPEPSVVTIYKCSGCGTRFMEFSKGDHFCCFCGAEMYKEENACEADIETAT